MLFSLILMLGEKSKILFIAIWVSKERSHILSKQINKVLFQLSDLSELVYFGMSKL